MGEGMEQNSEVRSYKYGKWQVLKVVAAANMGVYLGTEDSRVLLPRKQVPGGTQVGDEIKVFVYKDSSDRPIATINEPKLVLGEIAVLKVKQVTKIGAFMDWGLEKDLFLPFGQQMEPVKEGMYYPVALYLDRSERLAASMWIDKFIKGATPDEKKKKKSLITLEADAENVYVLISKMGGCLEYDDKAAPEVIERDFGLSKNAFKKAVGVLYKARRLEINPGCIKLI